DWTGDLYNQDITIEFIQRLRDNRRFDSVDELVASIRADIDRARRILTEPRE
ncbi:MAG: riboflavin kinase, partial [Coriobacteriia bacterium]|nr:riboflavin kinase [Coriobacteriia bacterium]